MNYVMRRLEMSYVRALQSISVHPVDAETKAWLEALPLEMFAALEAAGAAVARPDQPFRAEHVPARAAEYEQKLRGLFPDDEIVVRVHDPATPWYEPDAAGLYRAGVTEAPPNAIGAVTTAGETEWILAGQSEGVDR